MLENFRANVLKQPGLPRMGLVTNGTRFSQTEIPKRKFPNFFVNGKRLLSRDSVHLSQTAAESKQMREI